MDNVKVGVCQLRTEIQKEKNIEKAGMAMKTAFQSSCGIFVLPEIFICPYDNRYFNQASEDANGGYTIERLSKYAVTYSMIVVAGSIPEKVGDKLYNTTFVIDKNGSIIAKHRKIHLFDMDMKDGARFKESDTFSAGDKITVFDSKYGEIGIGTGYDIYFPEVFSKMAEIGVRTIIIPGAFNHITGPAHLELLARTRALENQSFVIMASPASSETENFRVYGHSMIIDPWGRKLLEISEKEELRMTVLDFNLQDKIRRELPLLTHKRRDI